MNETPQQLVDLAATAGALMIASGAETQRVEDAITRILSTSGYPEVDPFVLPTGITVTLSDGQCNTVSVTRRVKARSSHLRRVCAVNRVSRAFCAGEMSYEEAMSRLEEARTMKSYPLSVQVMGAFLISAGFAYMFGGSLWDTLASGLCGIVWQLAAAFLGPRIGRSFVTNILSCFIMAGVALGLTYLANTHGSFGLQSHYIIVGAMMPVVPGVAITNAIRDILGGDYVASLCRGVEAFLTASAVAIGVGCAITAGDFFGGFAYVAPDFAFLGSAVTGLDWLWEVIAAFFGALGFCCLLEVPKKLFVPASLTAVMSWMVYLLAGVCRISNSGAVILSSMAIYLMSYVLARREREPVIVFLIIGILPLVPGFAIYRSVYYMITATGSAPQALLQTLTLAADIALGIFFADTINELLKKGIARQNRKNKADKQA